MSKKNITESPNCIHPERPSAVGSRNSSNREERDEYSEAREVVDEEIDKLLNHVKAKLPPEVLNKLDVMGGVKEKLHNYYNQVLQNMQNRYLVTVEDELLKKYRNLIDREEFSQLNRYTPRMISEIIEKIGGRGTFDTNEIEKSIAGIYGHLQGHIERGVRDLQDETNAVFRRNDDIGTFIQRENTYAVVKCAFKNNPIKPKTVTDVKLAINVLDSELLVPIYHYQQSMQDLLKETISRHIHSQIDGKIAELNRSRLEEGSHGLSESETVAEKLNELGGYLSFEDDREDENSKRYDYVAKRFFDSLSEMDSDESENRAFIRDHVEMSLAHDNIQNGGFNLVVNALTTILDSSKLGYQYINNYKNVRVCVIQEYPFTAKEELPDEAFSIRISYFNAEQLKNLRKAYDLQADELLYEIEKAGRVVGKLGNEFYIKQENNQRYRKLSGQILGNSSSGTKTDGGEYDRLWHEISLRPPPNSGDKAKVHRAFNNELKKKIGMLEEKVCDIFGNDNPKTRQILDRRIDFLKEVFQKFSDRLNPHHIRQGLVLEVDITSVKKTKTTMRAISNVLNEFLFRVSKGPMKQPIVAQNRRESEDMGKKFTSVLRKVDRSLEGAKA